MSIETDDNAPLSPDSPLGAALDRLATEPAPDPNAPQPMYAGTFAIYSDGNGGFVLVADVNGETHRRHIPATVVRMINGGGGVMSQLAGFAPRRARKLLNGER